MKHFIKQHDIKDCGAACLSTICSFYDVKVPIVKMRELMHVDKNGASIYAITQTATKLGFEAQGYECDYDELIDALRKGEINLPAIVHMHIENMEHFVVLLGIKNNKIKIFDPGRGKKTYLIDEFLNLWTGYFVVSK